MKSLSNRKDKSRIVGATGSRQPSVNESKQRFLLIWEEGGPSNAAFGDLSPKLFIQRDFSSGWKVVLSSPSLSLSTVSKVILRGHVASGLL